MRNVVVIVLLVAVAVLGVVVSRGPAAPALADKPAKWQYAELQSLRERDPRFGAPGGFGGGGFGPPGAAMPGGGFQVGGVAAPAPAAPAAPPVTVRWATADEEIDAVDWKALGDKLRAPAAKKDGSATMHRLRVLNRLSADGWEIYEHNGTNSWTFRRRAD